MRSLEQLYISVIVPVYNAQAYLAEAISSVQQQTHSVHEIIMIDDGSTDQSLAIAQAFKGNVRVVTQDRQGAAAARNLGVSLAQGNLLAFLDADDRWCLDKIEKQINILRQYPDTDMVFAHLQQFHQQEKREILKGTCHGTLLIWKESYERVGPLATNWKVGEFLDWYARAQDKNLKEKMLDEVMLERRIHDDNLGIREKSSTQDYLKVVKAALDRRRCLA